MGNKAVALGILILAMLLAPNVQSATLTVCDSGCDSTTIQAAIDLASDGDVVTVSAGTYSESVVIYRPLTLLGAKYNVDARNGAWESENLTIINSGSGYNGILINASNVTVNGFKITESGTDAEIFSLDTTFESAIYVYNEDTKLENIEILYNWIDANHGSGIVIRNVHEPTVEYNYISNNGDGVWAAAGIGGQELTGGSFSHNEFFNDISYGLYFGGGKVGSLPTNTTGVLISGNDFHHNEKYGLQLYGYYEPWSVSNDGIILLDNDFHDNGRCGIKITDFTNTILINNIFNGNGANGTSDKYKFGALISAYYTAVGTLFIGNDFSDNELGGIYILLELEDADLSSIVINQSNFLDDGLGVTTATRGAFDFPFVINAENNWWGTAIPNSSNFYGNLTYYPFCLNAGCTTTIEEEIGVFTGDGTTNFSAISNWSSVALALDGSNGLINWSASVDLHDSTLMFSDYVTIGHNSISVDTSNMPELNQPATLTFRNSGFAGRNLFKLYRNGVICPYTICTDISVSGGDVTFTANQMSTYTLVESIQNYWLFTPIIIIIGVGVLIFILQTFLSVGHTTNTTEDMREIIISVVAVIVIIMIIGLFVAL